MLLELVDRITSDASGTISHSFLYLVGQVSVLSIQSNLFTH